MHSRGSVVDEWRARSREVKSRRSLQAVEHYEMARASLLAVAAEYSARIGKIDDEAEAVRLREEMQSYLDRLRQLDIDDTAGINDVLEDAATKMASLRGAP